jgi:transcriptional regulator GlxA family with amidase domain
MTKGSSGVTKMSKRMGSGRRHSAIVARLEKFLEANLDRPLYLAEICPAIGVAERTLRLACEEHLRMGPIRYVSLRRMHIVRCALLRADPSRATVTGIATDHGFWELGRFSVTYRSLFGETPSETLRRSDWPIPPPGAHELFPLLPRSTPAREHYITRRVRSWNMQRSA